LTRRTVLVNLLVVLGLLALATLFFHPVIFGGKTLLPLDNLFTFEPWQSFAARFGVQVPHNELLSDLILENYVWKRFILQALKSRSLPLWNPYILAGQPFLAAGQHSALYPLSLIFYIVPLARAYGYYTVLQLLLASVFMYIYARTIRLQRLGSLIAAITFAFSGFMVVSVVHPMIIAAASWLPLLLAVVERLVRTQEEQVPGEPPKPVAYIPWIALGALVLALQFLAGHVEIAYYVVLVTVFYAAWRIALYWQSTRSWLQAGKLTLAIVLLVGLGVGLAAIQMVPYYELVRENFRQGSATYQQVTGWAYRWRRLIAFLVPDFFGNPTHHSYRDAFSGHTVVDLRNVNGESIQTIYWGMKNYVEGGSYVGVLPLLLALVAVWKSRTRYVRIFLTLAITSLAFVFGTPLYALLYYGLPGINQLHSPFRWVFPYTFSVSVLAGCGASWLAANRSEEEETRSIGLLGGATLALGLFGAGLLVLCLRVPEQAIALAERVMFSFAQASQAFSDGRAFFSYQFRNFLLFFLTLAGAGATLLLRSARVGFRGVKLWKLLAPAVIVAELFAIGMSFNPAADPAILSFEPPVISFLKHDEGLWRFTTLNLPDEKTLNANVGMFYDLQDARGYDSIIARHYVDYMQLVEPQWELLYNRIAPLHDPATLDSPLLDLLNVKYVVTAQTVDNADYTLVYDNELRVYRNEGCLPRAFVVHQARVIPEATARSEALRQFDPRQEVILETAPEGALPEDSIEEWRPAQIVQYDPNEVLVEVSLTTGGYLVLADSHSAGWKAYDTQPGEDEQEVPIYRANGAFRAVLLPPGEHVVRFKYTPFSLKLGLFISFLAGVILILLLSFWLWRRFYSEEATDSAVKRVAKNALTPMVLNLLNRVIDMAFAMLYLRVLAPAAAGRYHFAFNFIGYFETVVLFGLGTWITREISKHPDQTRKYWSNSVVLRWLIWLASVPVMAATVYAYVRFSGLTADSVLAIAFFAVALIPQLLADSFTAAFYAHEKMEYPAAISSVSTVLRVVLSTMALLLGYGFVGMAAASLLVNLSTALILGTLARRLFFRPKLEFDAAFARTMVRDSLPLMVNNLLAKVFFMSDVLLLKPLRGDAEVGYYSAAYKYIRGLDVIPSYFTLAIFPLISRFAESQRDSLVRAYILSIKLLMLIALPIAVGTTFIARPLISILAGPEYVQQSTIALQLLIWYMPVGFINSVTQYVLIAINQQHFLTRAFLFGAAFNVLSNLILIPRYGYIAASVITALSEVALLIPFYYCVRRNLTTLPWVEVFWRPVLAAAAMAVVMWLMQGVTIVLTIPVAAVTYLAVLAALGTFRQPDVALVLELLPAPVRDRLPVALARP
jgi:O-antigen/teichoic acid export membrane protein